MCFGPVYGKLGVMIKCRRCDLLWTPARRLARFVIVEYPKRRHCLLMSAVLSLSALEIIELYGVRFTIEHRFKRAIGASGTYGHHRWLKDMLPLYTLPQRLLSRVKNLLWRNSSQNVKTDNGIQSHSLWLSALDLLG